MILLGHCHPAAADQTNEITLIPLTADKTVGRSHKRIEIGGDGLELLVSETTAQPAFFQQGHPLLNGQWMLPHPFILESLFNCSMAVS